ncbi:MAG: CPBP family intramembrane metalloprotease [Gemmatimonadales bacterium]|nr:MAG: CPBP family intramembrane metalloprotease [Gemmatimonadales bacterium]
MSPGETPSGDGLSAAGGPAGRGEPDGVEPVGTDAPSEGEPRIGDDRILDPQAFEQRPPPEVMRAVRWRFRLGGVLALVTFVALLFTPSVAFLDALGVAAFFVLLPTLAIAQLPLMKGMHLERIPVYWGSILSILTLGVVGGLLALRLDPPAPAGFSWVPLPELLAWSVGLTGAALLVILLFRPVESWLGGGRPELLQELLPRTGPERRVFAGLSLSAGVGEELAYRAYAYLVLQTLGLDPWPAAVVACIPFGFLHAYQGPVGVVRTGLMGFILAVPVVVTGSLIPAMVAHTLIDLVVGLVLGRRLLSGTGSGASRVGMDGPASRMDERGSGVDGRRSGMDFTGEKP